MQFMRLFLFLFFVVLWEVAAEFSWIDSFIFSSPLRIAKTAWQMLQDGSLIMHIGVTLSETLISFALVVICGILLPFCCGCCRWYRRSWSRHLWY